jgi:hypothetical protein
LQCGLPIPIKNIKKMPKMPIYIYRQFHSKTSIKPIKKDF